jgi:energy-coupling factor transport system ATP-binding protein
METFAIQGFGFSYPDQAAPALTDVDLTVRYGEFITLCGKSGSGKSTLLRNLKAPIAPYGKKKGRILFYDRPLETVSFREQTQKIGYVSQTPDNQVVTDKVWHELAFGLESLGCDSRILRLRVAEMASFFGIQTWFRQDVASLSGGQKQILNLASVMAMQPDVLILDEPTGQLDPIAATDFLERVRKINREIGVTVIVSEQRLEEVMPMSDRVVVLDRGKLIADAPPKRVGVMLTQYGHDMFRSMPTPMQVFMEVEMSGAVREKRSESANDAPSLRFPITVRDGREWMSETFPERAASLLSPDRGLPPGRGRFGGRDRSGGRDPSGVRGRSDARDRPGGASAAPPGDGGFTEAPSGEGGLFGARDEAVIVARDVWFRYERGDNDVIRDFSMQVPAGRLTCLVGGNGTGKSTVLKLIAGLKRPYRGRITVQGRTGETAPGKERRQALIGLLPQSPQSLFVRQTVEADLTEMLDGRRDAAGKRLSQDEKSGKLQGIVALTELDTLLERHPYDLSGGEQQRAALAKVLLLEPEILLLDEPTKGMDNHFKEKFAVILRALLDRGKTVLMVSHDVEFCARHADFCALFFDGGIVAGNRPGAFFSGNSYYTTAANRMSRHVFEGAVTAEEVIALCKKNIMK